MSESSAAAATVARAVAVAVETVFAEPSGSVSGAYVLTGVDSIDLVEIAELTEQQLLAERIELHLDDSTLAGWPDVAAFAANAVGQLPA